ncbi:MAG: hypothetical protein KGL63_09465 [Betaproteobacteria bacterium]|nr:hypothetical protein [Betaproteobacteria bacterium]
MTVHVYTPAHVSVAPKIEDHIHVIGGQDWDFSRFSLVTPVVVVGARKAPAISSDGRCECFEVSFDPGDATLSEAMQWRLLQLPRNRRIWVAAGPSALAHMRAQAVSEFLRSHGRKPVPRRLYRDGVGNNVMVLTDSQ